MPAAEDVSWADEVELEGGSLPPSTEVREKNFKIVTDYKVDNGIKNKIVRTFRIEKRIVSKTIAARKAWTKFGESSDDKPGPDPATTIVAEDVYMQYISSKEEDNKQEDNDAMEKLKALGDKNVVKCRTCSGDHWTSKCPWKDTVMAGGKVPEKEGGPPGGGGAPSALPDSGAGGGKPGGSKYVPPSMRDGAVKRSDNPNMARRDDTTAIRISNLSESTVETDLEELVKPFGPIQKLYLAKDKITGHCKGFAYIHFKFRNDAAKAIEGLNGHGYDYLILNVDWSKPPAHST